MKRLPNAQRAIIPESKVVDYLLSRTHIVGRAKARFFESFGFSRDEWEELRSALRDHAERGGVVAVDETEFGQKFVVEGRLVTPDGRHPVVRTVWFIEAGQTQPRFVTSYPVAGGAM